MKFTIYLYTLIIAMFMAVHHGYASQSKTWNGEIDGVPVWITVVPESPTAPSKQENTDDWWDWGNTTTDAYILAINSPDDVRLIVDFNLDSSGNQEALIYINQLGKERLGYSIEGNEVKVLSNQGYPYIRIKPHGNVWMIDGKANYNLDIQIDGQIPGREGGAFPKLSTDGVIDWESWVGSNHPGVAEWDGGQVINDPKPNTTYQRFSASLRMVNAPEYRVASAWIPGFPYLAVVGKNIGSVDQIRCPYTFDVRNSSLNFSSFIGIQNGIYAINSSTLPPNVDFEAPFAWYNFDPASRFPKLVIRSWYYPATDPLVKNFNSVIPGLSTFRYSWKVNDEQKWDYSLQVAGGYAYTQTVQIGPVSFLGVLPEALPDWILSKPWYITTFLEATKGYQGEGIYFYSPQTTEVLNYFYGRSDQLPSYYGKPFLQENTDLLNYYSLPVDFRGEFLLGGEIQPSLYYSPIDQSFHLKYAQGGFWYLGNGQILRYDNINNDAFIDGWISETFTPPADKNGSYQLPETTQVQSLYQLTNGLFYSGNNTVIYYILKPTQADIETTPPDDEQSWEGFKKLVNSLPEKKNPINLSTWLDGLGQQVILLNHAIASLMEYKNGVYRFQLELQDGFSITGQDLFGLHGLEPGSYLVSYDGSAFHVETLTPPQLSLNISAIPMSGQEGKGIYQVDLLARNTGIQDALKQSVTLYATCGRSTTQLLNQTTNVPVDDTRSWSVSWLPQPGHGCTLSAVLTDTSGVQVASTGMDVPASGTKADVVLSVLGLSDMGRKPVFILILLGAVGGLFGMLFYFTRGLHKPDKSSHE